MAALASATAGIDPGVIVLGQGPERSGRVRVRAAREPGRDVRRLPPQIDLWAPGAFDDSDSAERRVRYRVDATVLFPLFSIPLAHRENVGFASAVIREIRAESSFKLRAYELFATSFPERARGLNRTGFIREAVGTGPDGVQWTAHFGALSSSPERNRREVELDADETRQRYTIMDGFTDDAQSGNTEVRLELNGSWSSPDAFYASLLPAWRKIDPEGRVWSRPQALVPHMEPLGFLGILQRSLEVAAGDISRRRRPLRVTYPFAHKGKLMRLALVGHRVDSRRARRLAEAGVIPADTDLHRVDYRILSQHRDEVQRFRVWTDLTDAPSGSADVLPIAFEFKAKSFLRLHATRTE